jgi:RHS repeat-associated protein
VVTDSLATVTSRHDYMPFGEEVGAGIGGRTTGMGFPGVSDGLRQKFTSKERDIETGLDYFLARYYSSTQGRFTSPDEFTGGPDELYDFADDASDNPTFYADLTNPQSLNKYQYTYNNPVNLVDPDGHCPDCPPGLIVSTPSTTAWIIRNPGKVLDIVQTAISVVGLVPGAGEPADVFNAGMSGARGNYGEAALDLGGALGPVGSAAAVVNRVRKIAGTAGDTARAVNKADNAANTSRAGMNFTKKEKQQVIEQNKTKNAGQTKCDNCGTNTVPGQQAKKGVPKPRNETNVDHVVPKSRGGRGRADNGQVLCRLCNQKKGNTLPQ